MIRRVLAPVLRNERLHAPDHHVLTFSAPGIASEAKPGQFVAVAAETGAQILRRPFSLFSADPDTGEASILFNVHGPTSRALSGYGPGSFIDLLGPLGGRVYAEDPRPGARHILVGGGYGVPPLAFFARRLREARRDAHVILVDGARTKQLLVGTEGLETLGVALRPCTEDGTCGFHGRVTGVLEELLNEPVPATVYCCGPTPMMRAVAQMAMAKGVPCQVTMEVFMPCGMGVCQGCAVGKQDGTFAMGCLDGPVFDGLEVGWE
ncbi:MAG TPA: dihydroorotate dehydrogenase electron transfer subunit [Armatimonadaceae bacterium]|nr:dihydroorotate dehydrogenase electron transfer subunit [Armatimonadaceae bacterium]